MSASAGCQLLGKWRITKADIWDRDYLTSSSQPTSNSAKTAAASSPSVPCKPRWSWNTPPVSSPSTGTGFDEGDEMSGSGSADLTNDGYLEIELSFHNGDDATLQARRC